MKQRNKPDASFAYVPGRIFDCFGPGLAMHDIDAEREFDFMFGGLQGSNDCYVAPYGADVSGGGTLVAPWRTIQYAMQNQAGLGTIWLLPGTYTDNFVMRGSWNTVAGGSQARAIKLKAWGGPGSVTWRAPGQQPNVASWSAESTYPGVYSFLPSGGGTADYMNYSDGGRVVDMPYLQSVSAVQSSGCGWYQAADSRIYVGYRGLNLSSSNYNGNLSVAYRRSVENLIYGACVYLEGINFAYDSQLSLRYENSFRPVLFARNCSASYLEYHNFQSYGALVLFQNCTSHHSLLGDGFNYYNDPASGQPSEAVEVECVAYCNGVVQSRQWPTTDPRNCQGSSTHEATRICRVNGRYYNNHAQNIADTYTTSRTWMLGSILGNPWGNIAAGSSVGGFDDLWLEGNAWLDGVQAGGRLSTYGLHVHSGTTATYNCGFSGTSADTIVESGASLTTYQPF